VISVVIPSKTITNLAPCVEAVKQHQPDAQIIVVDDGVETLPKDTQAVQGVKPFIFARNINLGIQKALKDGAEGVVLLNDDAILTTPGGFEVMAQACRNNAQYGLIGATCNNVGNRNQWPQAVGLRVEKRMVCFVCTYIPRQTIERVGLLDERFVAYGFDDDDYCLRVRLAGLLIGIHDGCYVDHGSLKSTFRGDPTTPAGLNQNAVIFKAKWGRGNHEL